MCWKCSPELQKRGHEVSVALPYYHNIRDIKGLKIKTTGVKMTIQVGAKRIDAEILECMTPNRVQVFLVRRDEYFDRSGYYGADGRAYEDNAERFTFFSKAVVELARRMKPVPDIIHVHDWQTALVPVFVHEYGLPFKTVLTLHNVAYQGVFWGIDFSLTNLPASYYNERSLEFYNNINFLKGGIVFADAVTTVSERYAREIQTPEFGSGLELVLQQHSNKLTGILNGADSTAWNPSTDKWLPKKYRAGGFHVRQEGLPRGVARKARPPSRTGRPRLCDGPRASPNKKASTSSSRCSTASWPTTCAL